MLKSYQKNHLFDIAASPFFLALPLAIVLILFLPNPALRYKVTLVRREMKKAPNSKTVFQDLNHDSVDEKIIILPNFAKGEACIKVLACDGCNYEQWNFPGYYQHSSDHYFCADLNGDGYPEIYVFYNRNDSVFMGAVQPYPAKKVLFLKKFITTVNKRNGKIDYNVHGFNVADMNQDGVNDLIFYLNAGFSKQPREIFIYNSRTNTLRHSKSLGAKFGTMILQDMDQDSIPEIYCRTTASGNIHDSLRFPYNDYSSWFMGFDHNLKFLFPPIRLDRFPMNGNICSYTNKAGENFIISRAYDHAKQELRLISYKANGKVYTRKIISIPYNIFRESAISFIPVRYHKKPYFFVGLIRGKFILSDAHFRFKSIKTKLKKVGLRFTGDLNHDGENEYLFKSNFGNHFSIVDHDLKTTGRFTADIKLSPVVYQYGIIHLPRKQSQFFIESQNVLNIYSYSPDLWYYLKYPLWVILYGLVVLILWFTQRMQHLQHKRKQEIENTINMLQLKTIKSQMDPHFMFNVLNGLASNVAMGNKQESYTQIVRFSHLLRAMMKRTDSIDIRLGGETDFVRNYLELEKFRFKEDFEYKIIFDKNIDLNIRIPRMLIHLLVENAIKHGLRGKTGQKKLTVHGFIRNGRTVISVDDNGIGRTAAAQKRGTGKGYKLIKDMIKLYRKTGGHNIKVTTIDKYDDTDNPTGTLVEVEISNGESSDAE